MSAKQKNVGSSPAHDQNFFVQVFSGLVRLFFRKYFKSVQRAPLLFLPILQKNRCSKTPKGHPFTFFGTMRLTGDRKRFQKHFGKKNSKKNSKKNRIFFQFFLHTDTVEENTC